MSIRDNIIKSNFGIAGSSNTPSSATNPYQQYANELHKYYDTAPTLNIAGYQSLLNATRDIYAGMGVQDPDGAIKKQIVGSVLSEVYPQYTREQATKYASTIYKQATGYDVSQDELYKLFTGAFSSAAANFYTGYRSLELAADKYNMTDEEYEVAREEYLRDIKNTYKTYYNKEANEKAGNILGEIVYNMGNAAPSMIPGLLISAATVLLSGGAGAPSASIMLWNALKHGTAYTGKQVALGVGGTVARSVSSALMEAGSISTELMENNVDPDVILKYSALTGVVAGLAEELISDAAWGKVTEWLGSLRKTVGQKAITKAWKESFKEVLIEGALNTLKVGFGEGLTEAAQEPTELLFTKHAYKMMEGRSAAGSDANDRFKELADCSIEEYANAGWQAFKGAFAGQMGFGFLRTGVSAGVSARSIKRYKSASKISNPTDANGIVKASDIVFFGKGQQSESEASKVAPVSVVKVGDKFVAFDATDDQKNAIANNSKEYIFVKETATKVPSSVVQLNYSMKLDDINKTIITAYKNKDIYGFKYLDKNGKETSNMNNVATVLIATDDVESVAVEVSDKSQSKLSAFETDIFGKTFTKYTETQENETASETANEDESQRTADVSEQFDDLYEEAEETKRQEEADKQAEEIKKETLNEETKTEQQPTAEPQQTAETQQTAEQQEEAPVVEQKADVSAVSDDVKEAVIDLLKDKNELTEEDVDSIVDESEGLNEATIRELYNEAQKEKKAEASTEPANVETKEETKQETNTETNIETNTEEKPVTDNKNAETIKAEENEKKLNDRAERMRVGKEDSDKFKKAYRSIDSSVSDADAKSSYDTFYKAFKDLKNSKKKFQSVIIDKLNDREVKRAARITTVVAIGFAKAQGKSINEFMQSFNVSSENPGVGEFAYVNPLAQGWIEGADIYLSPNATPITIAHELAHHFLNTIDKNSDLYKDIEKTFKKTSLKDSNGKADVSEAFAQGLERYLRDGIVTNENLRGLFENLKEVFKGILNNRKSNNVTNEANREIFDRIFKEDKAEIISDAVEKAKLESKDNKEIVKNTEKEVAKANGTENNTNETSSETATEEANPVLPAETKQEEVKTAKEETKEPAKETKEETKETKEGSKETEKTDEKKEESPKVTEQSEETKPEKKEKIVIKQSDLKPAKVKETAKKLADVMTERAQETAKVIVEQVQNETLTAISDISKIDSSAIDKAKKESKTGNINDLDTSIKKSKMSIIGEQQSLDRYLVRNGLKSVDDKTTILSNGFLEANASLDRTLTAISALAFKGIKISNRDFDIFRCSNGELAVKINTIYDREGNRIENKGNDIWLYIGKYDMNQAKALSANTGVTTVDLQRGVAVGLRIVSDRDRLIDAMRTNVATDKITASYNETVRKEVDKNLGKKKEIKDIPYDVKNDTVESNLDKLYESDKPAPMKKKNDMSRAVADTVRKNILDNINDIYGMKTKDYEYDFSNDPESLTDLYQFDSSDVAKSINKALGINAFDSKDIFVYGDFDGNLIIKINKGIYTDENGNPVSKDSVVPTYIFIPSIYVDGMDSYPISYVYDDRDMYEEFEAKFLDENGEFHSIDKTKKPFKPIPYEYDARIVAEAFLQNYQYAIDDEFKKMQSSEIQTSLPEDGVPIMYSLAENTEDPALKEQREEQFIDMMAGIVVDNTPENTLRQLSKGDIENNVFANEKIDAALSKLDKNIKEDIKKNIVAYLKDASESYPRIASRLAKVMTNKTEASKVRKEFLALIKEGLTHAESVKDFKKDITNSFRGEGFEEISATLNRIIDSCVADSKATVTNEEIDQVIRRFVNKDGTMVLYHINGDKNGTNPIIKFANWAHIGTDDDGNPVKVKNKPENAVDSDYMETSYRLLGSDNEFSEKNAKEVKERLDSDEISITDLVSSLYANSGFYLPDFVKGVFTNYMSEDFLDKIILAYKENVERSSQQLHEANNDIIKLSARIKALEKTNRDVSGWLEEQKLKNKKIKEGNKNANAKKDEIIKEKRDQIEKNKAQIKELKDQLKNVIAEREKLKAEIAFMVENNVFTDAQKINFEYRKLRKAITKSTGRDARAVEIMTPIMEMFDGESYGDAIDMKLFVPRWRGYENSLNGFAKKLIENGIIAKNSEGVWVIGKTLKECNLDELAVVSDAMNTYYKETTEEMNSRKKAYINGMMIDKKAIIDDIRKFYKLQDDNEDFAQAVRDFVSKNDLSSAEKSGKKKKLFNSLELEVMSNILKRECPAMYAYFLGGYIDYDIETQEGVETARVFIKNNLNSATENEKANTIKRKNAFVNKISELFNVKPDDVNIYGGRIFTGKTDTVGKIDFNDFKEVFGYMPIEKVQDPDNAMLTHYSVNENVPESMRPFMEFIVNRYQKNSDKLATKWAKLQKKKKLTQEERIEAFQKYKQEEKLYTEEELTDSFFSRDGIESSYNISELMGIYLYARQTDGIRDMLTGTKTPINTNNLTVGNILSVLAKFNLEEDYKPYRELSEYMLKDMGSRYTQTADVYYNITGKILDKIPNYFLIRDKIGFYEYEMGLLGQDVSKSSKVRNKSVLDRSGRHALDLNIMTLYTQAIDEQEHYIAFAELCDRYDKMFFSDELNKDEEKNYDVSLDVSKAFIYASEQSGTHNDPQAVINALHSWYEIVKNPGDYRGDSSYLLSKMISNMATSVLWGNISVVLQQFPTYVLVMRRVGFKNMMNALMKNIAHPNTLQDFIYGKSAQMRDRARLDTDTYKQAVLDPNSWLGKKFGETGWKISEVEKKIIKAGLQPMETVDKWVANASWMAVYEWNLENLERVDDMSDADFDEMCAQNATQFIMDTNSSKNAKDNALIYSNRDTAVRSLLLFTSQLNKQFNMIYGSVLDYKKNGKTKEQFNAIMLNAATLGLAMSGALIATGAIVPKDKDDRELSDFLLNYLKQLGLETVGMFPLIGDPLKQVLNGDVYSETNLASTTVNAYKAIRRKASGDKTLKDSTFYNALTSEIMQTFELVGLPSTQINKTYRAVRDKNPLQLVSSKWANLLNEE